MASRLSIVLSLAGLIAALWIVASLLGYFQIRHPLAAMTAKMRTVRAGEYALEPLGHTRDEIGEAVSHITTIPGRSSRKSAGIAAGKGSPSDLLGGFRADYTLL
jgi:hypothetical protein